VLVAVLGVAMLVLGHLSFSSHTGGCDALRLALLAVSSIQFSQGVVSARDKEGSLLFKELSQEHAAPSHNRLLARHADVQI